MESNTSLDLYNTSKIYSLRYELYFRFRMPTVFGLLTAPNDFALPILKNLDGLIEGLIKALIDYVKDFLNLCKSFINAIKDAKPGSKFI